MVSLGACKALGASCSFASNQEFDDSCQNWHSAVCAVCCGIAFGAQSADIGTISLSGPGTGVVADCFTAVNDIMAQCAPGGSSSGSETGADGVNYSASWKIENEQGNPGCGGGESESGCGPTCGQSVAE